MIGTKSVISDAAGPWVCGKGFHVDALLSSLPTSASRASLTACSPFFPSQVNDPFGYGAPAASGVPNPFASAGAAAASDPFAGARAISPQPQYGLAASTGPFGAPSPQPGGYRAPSPSQPAGYGGFPPPPQFGSGGGGAAFASTSPQPPRQQQKANVPTDDLISFD